MTNDLYNTQKKAPWSSANWAIASSTFVAFSAFGSPDLIVSSRLRATICLQTNTSHTMATNVETLPTHQVNIEIYFHLANIQWEEGLTKFCHQCYQESVIMFITGVI